MGKIDEDLQDHAFLMSFRNVQERVHQTAIEKGWWDELREPGTILALIHCEVSECMEAIREGNPPSKKVPEFSQAEEELADVIIRIMDYAAYNQWDVAGALVAKAAYNKGRAYRHGGKAF